MVLTKLVEDQLMQPYELKAQNCRKEKKTQWRSRRKVDVVKVDAVK
jgi:hypothetical protein